MSLMLQTLGPRLDAHVDGAPIAPKRAKKAKLLLALLAAHHQHDVSREWVAARLWPDSDPISGAHNLRQTLSDLRQSLGADAARIVGDGRNLRLDIAKADIDVVAFDKAVAKGDPESLKRAVDIYAGPFLEGSDEPWIIGEREPRHRSVLAALDKLACSPMEQDDINVAIGYRRKAVAIAPLDEPVLRNLMIDLRVTGDHAGMVDALRAFEKLLAKEDPFARPSAETMELVKETRTPSTPKPPRPFVELPDRPPLPAPLTELIGRDRDVAEIATILARKRLITLTGPGGVGKTRLAIAAARSVEDQFQHGAVFVDLAAIRDPELIPTAAASELMLIGSLGRISAANVCEHLRDCNLLLIFDNCEHVIDRVAEFTDLLLTRCPGVRVLATSREPLQLTGEKVRPVSPLALPDVDNVNWVAAADYPAVRLFINRAEDASEGFALSPHNAANTIAVCRRLDGIPLAIELAAIMVATNDIGSIASSLDKRFDLLTHGRRTSMPRHRTLQAMVDWGYDLLTDDERLLLRRLAVFVGNWRLADARAVCACKGELADERIQHLLFSLTRKSFVVFDARNEVYRLLETIREYALQKLDAYGELTSLRKRHMNYYSHWLTETDNRKLGSSVDVRELEAALSNVRSAMDWSVENSPPEVAVKFCSYLAWFVGDAHMLVEGRARFDSLLSRNDLAEPSRGRAEALQMAGWFSTKQADVEAARRYLDECCEVCRIIGDIPFLRTALIVRVETEQVAGEISTALSYACECMEITPYDDESYAIIRTQAATLMEINGDYDAALSIIEEAIDYWSCHRVRHLVSELADIQRASIYTGLGRIDEARTTIRNYIFRDFGAFWTDTIIVAVRIAVAAGRFFDAALVYMAADRVLARHGYDTVYLLRPDAVRLRLQIERALSDSDWMRAKEQSATFEFEDIARLAVTF